MIACTWRPGINDFYQVAYSLYIIVYSRSVDPQKLCIGVKYYLVHTMHSMPYYTYGSPANLFFLGPIVFIYICIYQKNDTVTRIYVVLEILKLNKYLKLIVMAIFLRSTEREWTLVSLKQKFATFCFDFNVHLSTLVCTTGAVYNVCHAYQWLIQ